MKNLPNSLLLTGLSCLLILLGCTSSQEASQAKTNDIVVQVLGEPESLHPTNGRLGARSLVMYYTAQQLNRLDPQTKRQAPLIASLPKISNDGLSYTYRIDPDAVWNDGQAITSEDVAFSIKAAASPLTLVQSGRAIFEKIAAFEPDPDDERKFSLVMRDKYVGNLFIVNDIFIIDKRFFDPEGLLDSLSVASITEPGTATGQDERMKQWAQAFNDTKYNNQPEFLKGITGPYKVTEWTPSQLLVLTKNENYWGKGRTQISHQQLADHLIFKPVSDENAVELQVKQQKVDVALAIPSQAFKSLKENELAQSNYYIDFRARDAYTYIAYNNRPDGIKQPLIFNDRDVRWAFSYVMPIDDIIRDFYNGQAQRITSPISVASLEYNKKLEAVPFSLDSAKARLDRAGWIDTDGDQVRDKIIGGKRVPLAFKLTYPAPQQTLTDIVQRIIAEARKVGMDVAENPVNFGLLGGLLASHEFDAVMLGSSSSPVPYDFTQLWGSENWEKGENFTGFGTAYTDSLINDLKGELDPAKRKAAIDHMQALLFEEQPVAFFFNSANRMAVHKRFGQTSMYEILPYVLLNTLSD